VLTKILQRPRLAAYLEQSTRYIAYDAPMPGGGYRYYRDAELGPRTTPRWTRCSTPTRGLPRVREWVDASYPRADGEPEAAARAP
jgi:thymidylate synthase ThyX